MDDARPLLEHHGIGAVDHVRRGRSEAGVGADGAGGLVGLVGHAVNVGAVVSRTVMGELLGAGVAVGVGGAGGDGVGAYGKRVTGVNDVRPLLEHDGIGAIDRVRRGCGEAGLGTGGAGRLVGLVGHRRQCWRRGGPAP